MPSKEIVSEVERQTGMVCSPVMGRIIDATIRAYRQQRPTDTQTLWKRAEAMYDEQENERVKSTHLHRVAFNARHALVRLGWFEKAVSLEISRLLAITEPGTHEPKLPPLPIWSEEDFIEDCQAAGLGLPTSPTGLTDQMMSAYGAGFKRAVQLTGRWKRERLCERCHVTPTFQTIPMCEQCLPQCVAEWYPPEEGSASDGSAVDPMTETPEERVPTDAEERQRRIGKNPALAAPYGSSMGDHPTRCEACNHEIDHADEAGPCPVCGAKRPEGYVVGWKVAHEEPEPKE